MCCKKHRGKSRAKNPNVEREVERRLALENQFNPTATEEQRRVRAVLIRAEVEAEQGERPTQTSEPKRRSPTLSEVAARKEREEVLAAVRKAMNRDKTR